MTRVPIWMIIVLFPVVLYAACQGSGNDEIMASELETGSVLACDAESGNTIPVEAARSAPEPVQDEPEKEGKGNKQAADTPPVEAEADVVFEDYAFPPTISDVKYHHKAWYKNDCLRCHETGVGDATQVMHKGMSDILLTAKCRTCHVLIPGQAAIEPRPSDDSEGYEPYAFPPMIPASVSHGNAWTKDNCLLCHESGVRGAPKVKHAGMSKLLLSVKCRSCHVQVRSAGISGR